MRTEEEIKKKVDELRTAHKLLYNVTNEDKYLVALNTLAWVLEINDWFSTEQPTD